MLEGCLNLQASSQDCIVQQRTVLMSQMLQASPGSAQRVLPLYLGSPIRPQALFLGTCLYGLHAACLPGGKEMHSPALLALTISALIILENETGDR